MPSKKTKDMTPEEYEKWRENFMIYRLRGAAAHVRACREEHPDLAEIIEPVAEDIEVLIKLLKKE